MENNLTETKLGLRVRDEQNNIYNIQDLKAEFPTLDLKLLAQLALGRIDNYQNYYPISAQPIIPFAEIRLRDKSSGEIVELTRETLWDFCEENGYSLYNLICFILGWRSNFYNYELLFNFDTYLAALIDEIVEEDELDLLLDEVIYSE